MVCVCERVCVNVCVYEKEWVCVYKLNLKCALCWHIHLSVHSTHTHKHILMLFEDHEPMELKEDIARTDVWMEKSWGKRKQLTRHNMAILAALSAASSRLGDMEPSKRAPPGKVTRLMKPFCQQTINGGKRLTSNRLTSTGEVPHPSLSNRNNTPNKTGTKLTASILKHNTASILKHNQKVQKNADLNQTINNCFVFV